MLFFALVSVLQSCDDDGYSVGDLGWDWATVRATGGGGYYLEGDRWGIIDPATTSIPWFRPVDGQRVVAFFNPLVDTNDGVRVKMEGVQGILTKEVEMMTAENEEEFGNDPIVIYEGDMWLGGKYLNIVFVQNLPYSEKHRISLVQNKIEVETPETPETPETFTVSEDGYVHLELRYNTYKDVTKNKGYGRVSYNLEQFYPTAKDSGIELKGFKVKINSKENGEGRVIVLDLKHPVGVPEAAKDVHSALMLQ